MSLIREAEDKSIKGRGRLVLLDSVSPRMLGLADRVIVSMTRISNQDFLKRYEDAVKSNYRIFNLLGKRESVVAVRLLGINGLPDRIDAPASEMRFLISSSEAYFIDVDAYDDEPLAIYRLMVEE
ncbi:hypothetical protein GCM10007981_06000 [Thermocladium modestius]|uniref:Uncharacterized protein n=1 Tax=Thermocladium modestius TaxID=62609 RepID=A0A830GT28_9CREN|nr:hypothetical protein [Thermocladium modestius]GGP19985.1 hypothetical protein GCM10007981_06000 [Thermocladium modestius]